MENNCITSLYFIRHAQPDYSVKEDKIRPLTAEGTKDSEKLSNVLSAPGYSFDRFVSSPYKRSRDTIAPLARAFGKDILEYEGLSERKMGALKDITMRGYFYKQWKDFSYHGEGGESLLKVQERNMAVVDELLSKYKGENIVVGTHGTALCTILSYYAPDFGYEDFMDKVYCCPYVIRLDFDGKEFLGMEELYRVNRKNIKPELFTIQHLTLETIVFSLFKNFNRYQKVTKCLRKEEGKWVARDVPFVEEWSEKDLEYLVQCLRNTVKSGGTVAACFDGEAVAGFTSVESTLFGSNMQYAELTCLHTAYEYRGEGIGRRLFLEALHSAKKLGAKKLYISSHSAVETQAFYKRMGCVEAEEYNEKAVEKEPCDCQLECDIEDVLSCFTTKK